MKRIGIVGGIGPESTIAYYRLLVAAGHTSILINSVDVQALLGHMMRQELPAVAEYLTNAVDVLASGGADLAIVAANTPHIVFDQVRARSPLPMVSIVEATCAHVKAIGVRRVALLGTRFTMEGAFYPTVFAAAGIDLVVPQQEDLAYVHNIYGDSRGADMARWREGWNRRSRPRPSGFEVRARISKRAREGLSLFRSRSAWWFVP